MRLAGALLLFVAATMLLRSTALNALSARGITLDVLVFATVVWAMRNGETWGVSFGFALGLAADLDAAHWMGRHALMLALIGYVIGRGSHSLVRDSVRTQTVLLFGATLAHQAWGAAFDFTGLASVAPLLRRVALAALWTAPVGAAALLVVRFISGRSLFGNAALRPGPPL